MGKVKKYRFLLITLAVLAAAVVIALAAVIVSYRPNQSFTTDGIVSDCSGGSRLWGSGIRLDK
jgi:NADH:ubiquinone oxidoreductase subunit K